MTACPHPDVTHCPLYVAAHAPGAVTCCDADLPEGCAVARGEMDYTAACLELTATHPELIARGISLDAEAARRAQRERNLKINGIRP